MKIGIDVSRANHKEKTGVEWYTYFLVEALEFGVRSSEFGDIEFILYTDKPLHGKLGKLPDGWTEKVLKWPPKRLWTQLRLSWEMLINPPDVLFIPAHVFPIIHPKKTVMTVHDVAAKRFPESYSRFEKWYSLWSAKQALKKLWRIIVPSEFTKEELSSEFGVRSSDCIKVVKHGYDERYTEIKDIEEINRILKKYNIEKPFLLSVGRLEEKKNTRRIVQAFNKLNLEFDSPAGGLNLVLVGKPGFGYEKVSQEIDNSSFKKDILELGWIGPEELVYLLNGAEAFIFPSLYEGFGMPVLEAFACGTPVICSKGNSLEEVGGEAATYVDSKNIDSIAHGIRNLLQNKELREEKIKLGLERVKRFSWEKCAKQTLEILLSS